MALEVPVLSWIPPAPAGQPTPDEIHLGLADLDVSGYIALAGVTGIGLPQLTLTADAMPRGGTRVRHIQLEPRLLTVPILVEGVDRAQFLDRWRFLAEAFAATRRLGPGQLVSTQPDGSRRLIDCYYEAGWEGNPDAGPTWDTPVLTLYAPDPFWRAETPTLITRTAGTAGGVSFLSPLITITSSQTLGATTVNNPGTVEAWPSWRIVGPTSQVIATNVTTGESWTLDPVAWRGTALGAGEEVTITTEPAVVLGPAGSGAPQGTNWAGALNWPAAIMWGLDPGDSSVQFTVAGSSAATLIEASFYARYETT